MNSIVLLQLLIFAFSLWLGFYLLARSFKKLGLRFAGLGLVMYALGLALLVLIDSTPNFTAEGTLWGLLPLLLPSVFWMGATAHLSEDTLPLPDLRSGALVALMVVLSTILIAMTLSTTFTQAQMMSVPILFLTVSLIKIRHAFRTTLPRRIIIVILTATIFFLLGVGLLIAPVEWLSSRVVLMVVSFDLILLGFALGYLDAYEEGTRLWPDALRSLAAAGLTSLLFGGQVLLVMIITDDTSFMLLLLLFTIVATAILLETFSGMLQTILDNFIFIDNPGIRRERQLLRAVNIALPRTQETLDLINMDEDQFARLTRRALSHFNDLEKLAASPLTHLPAITHSLQTQGKQPTTLERAHELKALLTESILKLKPYSDADFDTNEAWRYFNVLYFPYVLGLKPYSAIAMNDDPDDITNQAIEWFQTQVPERTLYNWQTAASRLVARDLREAHMAAIENKPE